MIIDVFHKPIHKYQFYPCQLLTKSRNPILENKYNVL